MTMSPEPYDVIFRGFFCTNFLIYEINLMEMFDTSIFLFLLVTKIIVWKLE